MKSGDAWDIDLAVDCARPLGRRHVFVQGWLSWSQDGDLPTPVVLADGLPLRTVAQAWHARPDLPGDPGGRRSARGFIMIARRPTGAVATGGIALRAGSDMAPVPQPWFGPEVVDALAHLPWDGVFALMMDCIRLGDLAATLAPNDGLDGVFDRWINLMPRLDPAARDVHGMAHIDAFGAPSGECVVTVQLPRRLGPKEELRVVALLPADGGSRPAALDGPPALRGANGATFYGRLPLTTGTPAPACDLLVELRGPDGGIWFRTSPKLHPAPVFLGKLNGLTTAGEAAESFTWLRGVLETRRSAFDTTFRPARPPRGDMTDAPMVVVLHGMDDPFADRLAFLFAPEIERRATEVRVLGARASATTEIFLQRGRIPARSGLDLSAAVRHGTFRHAMLVPIDPLSLARALDAGGIDEVFANQVDGAALPHLLGLAALAGTLEEGETIARLARILAEGRGGRVDRHRFGRMPGATGQMIADHLAALWRDGAPALRARAVHEPG